MLGRRFTPLTYLLVSFAIDCISQSAEPAPLLVPPSEYWEGNDGPWSTFPMQVGTPNINETRALISTAIPNQWVVLTEACNTTSSACAASRGGNLFDPNASSTWHQEGIFNLLYEHDLNYTGNGLYGFDTVGLGFASNQETLIKNQTVAGIVQSDFWMGYIGINPQPTNFTNVANSTPSLFKNLHTQGLIPSLSYSYTAGAPYRLKGVYGSLIFGGMDISRFESNSITFSLGEDVTRDLVVGVQSIYSTENSGRETTLLSNGLLAYIDSTVPWIIMPNEACDVFEQAFGLLIDNATGLYLVSDSQHTTLSSRSPNFTFVLANSIDGGPTISISLPYNAFDLTVSAPYVNGTSRYFPLRRGNDGTYTLGRTFLQEAYLTVDYERGNLSVSQCVWDGNAKEEIQTIHSTNWTEPPPSANGSGSPTNPPLTTNAIVGIAIAAVLFIAGIAALSGLRHYRKWPFHNRLDPKSPEPGDPYRPKTQGQSVDMNELDPTVTNGPELPGGGAHHMGDRWEVYGSDGRLHEGSELPGPAVSRTGNRRELYGSDVAEELQDSSQTTELEGSSVGPEYYEKAALGSSSLDTPSYSLSGVPPSNLNRGL